jgi:hypothetical protein
MRVVWLAWYICGVCLLLALLSSVITYHPSVQHLAVVLPAASVSVALLAGGAAHRLGRSPLIHRVDQSWLLETGIVAIALTLTFLLILMA